MHTYKIYIKYRYILYMVYICEYILIAICVYVYLCESGIQFVRINFKNFTSEYSSILNLLDLAVFQ